MSLNKMVRDKLIKEIVYEKLDNMCLTDLHDFVKETLFDQYEGYEDGKLKMEHAKLFGVDAPDDK